MVSRHRNDAVWRDIVRDTELIKVYKWEPAEADNIKTVAIGDAYDMCH